MTDSQNAFNQAMGVLTQIIPTGKYDVYRPDYTSATTAQSLVYRGINFRLDPSGRYANPKAPGVEYFSAFWDDQRYSIAEGDILKPQTGNGSAPTVTMQTIINGNDAEAFRSNLIGSIVDGKNVLFSNIAYDISGYPGPEEPLNPSIVGSSTRLALVVVLFYRAGLKPSMRFKDQYGLTYTIDQIGGTGNILRLTLANKAN